MAEKKVKDTKKTDAKKSDKKECNKSKPVFICIIAVAVVAVLTFVILGICGVFSGAKIAGEYELVDIVKDGQSQSVMLSLMKGFGIEPSLKLNDDKTGSLSLDGSDTGEITYTDKAFKNKETGEEIKYTYKDGKITIEAEDEQMVFQKKQQ